MAILGLLYHASIAGFYAYAISQQPALMSRNFGGGWKFLTYINLWIILVYFGLSALNDVLNSGKFRRGLNFLFFSLVLPASLVVASAFWGLYAIDRNLIFPKQLDSLYPLWLNHVVHTVVFFVALVELAAGMRQIDAPRKRMSVLAFLLFASVYIGWLYVVAAYSGSWPYPFMNKMNDSQRATFFGTSVAFGVLVWRVGFLLNNIFDHFRYKPVQEASAKLKRS